MKETGGLVVFSLPVSQLKKTTMSVDDVTSQARTGGHTPASPQNKEASASLLISCSALNI